MLHDQGLYYMQPAQTTNNITWYFIILDPNIDFIFPFFLCSQISYKTLNNDEKHSQIGVNKNPHKNALETANNIMVALGNIVFVGDFISE